MFTSKKYTILLIGILLLGFGLRLAAVLKFGDFWFDEMFSFIYSQKSWAESLRFWTWETNPPLHMLLLKGWFGIFPHTEFWARVPSLIAGTATIFALYKLGKKFFGENIALLAAFFLALFPYHIFYSSMARGYALLMLLTILCIDSFYTLFFEQKKSRRIYLYFFFTHLFIIYTHLTAATVIASELAMLLMYKRDIWKKWILLYASIFVFWLPWAIPSFIAKATKETVGLAWFFNIKFNLKTISDGIQPMFGGFGVWQLSPIVMTLGLISIFAPLYYATKQKLVQKELCIMATPVLLTLVGVPVFGLWNSKFVAVVIPLSALWVAWGIYSWKIHAAIKIWIITLMLAPGFITLYEAIPITPWAPINQCMAQNAVKGRKQIFVHLNFVHKVLIDTYYTAPIPAVAYYPHSASDNWDKDLITKNYWRQEQSVQTVDAWAKENKLNAFDDIYVLYSVSTGIPLPEYLTQNGWQYSSNACRDLYIDNQVVLHYGKN